MNVCMKRSNTAMTRTFCSLGNSMSKKIAQRLAPVDSGSLIEGVRDRPETGVAQENDQRRPMPDIDDHDGDPG